MHTLPLRTQFDRGVVPVQEALLGQCSMRHDRLVHASVSPHVSVNTCLPDRRETVRPPPTTAAVRKSRGSTTTLPAARVLTGLQEGVEPVGDLDGPYVM